MHIVVALLEKNKIYFEMNYFSVTFHCFTLLGPAAAKRQSSGAPAEQSVAGAVRLPFFEMGHNVRQTFQTQGNILNETYIKAGHS